MNLKFDLHHGDCLEVLKTLPDNSIDAVVTDPPYHLTSIVKRFGGDNAAPAQYGTDGAFARASRGFMGKTWDGGDIAQNPALWSEVLRVLKPGGHCVAFSATRTGHRMAVAMEDAGFEVRDTCAWVFGSGFPKSLNVSERLRRSLPADIQCSCAPDCQQTAQDSPARYSSYNDRDGEQPLSDLDGGPSFPPSLNDAQGHSPYERKGDLVVEGQYNHSPSCDRHSSDCLTLDALSPLQDCQVLDSAPFDISLNKSSAGLMAGHRSQSHISSKQHLGDGSAASSQSISGDEYPYIPRCRSCGKLKVVNGLGSALKPAWEMIYLCRKPLSEPTVAANVLRWGTGAINVDGCRIETDDNNRARPPRTPNAILGGGNGTNLTASPNNDLGRFPANLCHDGSQEVLDLFPETGARGNVTAKTQSRGPSSVQFAGPVRIESGFAGDSGSAARFFACFPSEINAQSPYIETCPDLSPQPSSANDAPKNLSLQSELAVSALSRAVDRSTPLLALKKESYLAQNTSGSAQQFAAVETLLIELIQSIERRCSQGRLLERLTLSDSHACIAATQSQTGIITITISLSTSNGFAEAATFNLIETNLERGEEVCGKRFHYGSKANKKDRAGSRHPTVKPVKLMQWLCRMVTPPGGTVLDPFAGSGTTGAAAILEGFQPILIEREDEYVADIRRRLGDIAKAELASVA